MDESEAAAPATGDPISWRAVRPGAGIYDSDGVRAGTLREVEGDAGADIFHGLVVDAGDREVLVPADAVTSITHERIDVAMTASNIAALDPWSDAGASLQPAGEREAPDELGPPDI